MGETAFYISSHDISYTAIITTIAVIVGAAYALLTAASVRYNASAIAVSIVLSMILAPLCSRAVYWYCVPEQFGSIKNIFYQLDMGGYCLPGAILGVLLAAAITCLTVHGADFLSIADCLSPAAALCIGICRLSGFFSNDDKGNYVFTNSAFQHLPLSVPVVDEVTGKVQWRFASFLWEAIAGFVICAILTAMVVLIIKQKKTVGNGRLFMFFLSSFGAAQAAMESTRYDALHMRSNGFISMMQMVALIMMIIPPVYYTVVMCINKYMRGKVGAVLIKWLAIVTATCAAGIAEYFIQRKGSWAMLIHPIQLCLLVVACVFTQLLASMCNAGTDEEI